MKYVPLALLFFASTAFATGDHDCDHPVFIEVGCAVGPAGQDGQDGQDGRDGIDGVDGRDGVDGTNGADGRDGVDGINGRDGTNGTNGLDGANGRDGLDGQDGVVPTDWYEQMQRNNRYSLANDAIQMYLPQGKPSRLTLGATVYGGALGLGLGYAYMVDDESRTAFTFGVGVSHDETAVKGSVGFEF